MDIYTLLAPEAVRVVSQISSKKRLLVELGETVSLITGIAASVVTEGLQEREGLGPTGVGRGVALPHTRLEGLDRIVGVFVRLDKPLNYDSVDHQPVDLVFGLFAPRDSGVEHLKALALVSRTLRDPNMLVKLRANHLPSTLHAILTEQTISTGGAEPSRVAV